MTTSKLPQKEPLLRHKVPTRLKATRTSNHRETPMSHEPTLTFPFFLLKEREVSVIYGGHWKLQMELKFIITVSKDDYPGFSSICQCNHRGT